MKFLYNFLQKLNKANVDNIVDQNLQDARKMILESIKEPDPIFSSKLRESLYKNYKPQTIFQNKYSWFAVSFSFLVVSFLIFYFFPNGSINNPDFITKAMAYYEQQETRTQKESLLQYTKVISHYGQDSWKYEKMVNQKGLELLKKQYAHQNLQKIKDNFSSYSFTPEQYQFLQQYETWKDNKGNLLTINKGQNLNNAHSDFLFKDLNGNIEGAFLQRVKIGINSPEFYYQKLIPLIKAFCVEPYDNYTFLQTQFYSNGEGPFIGQQAIPKDYRSYPTTPINPDDDLAITYKMDQFGRTPFDAKQIISYLNNLQKSTSQHTGAIFTDKGEELHDGNKYRVFTFITAPKNQAITRGFDPIGDYTFPITERWKYYYYFNPESYQLIKLRHTIEVDNEEFEVNTTQYEVKTIESDDKIFDPTRYDFLQKVQLTPGCYKDTHNIEMTKMTKEEVKELFESLDSTQKKVLEDQNKFFISSHQ